MATESPNNLDAIEVQLVVETRIEQQVERGEHIVEQRVQEQVMQETLKIEDMPPVLALAAKDKLTAWESFATTFTSITGIRLIGASWADPLRRDNRYDGGFWAAFLLVFKFLALGRCLGDQAWDVVALTQIGDVYIVPLWNGTQVTTRRSWIHQLSNRQEGDYLLDFQGGTLSTVLSRLGGGVFQPVAGLSTTEVVLLSIAMVISCIQILGIMILVGIEQNHSAWFLERLKRAEDMLRQRALRGSIRWPIHAALILMIASLFFVDMLIWISFGMYTARPRPTQALVKVDVSAVVVVNNGTSYVPLPPGSPPVLIEYGAAPVIAGSGWYAAVGALVVSAISLFCIVWQMGVLYILGRRAYLKLMAENESKDQSALQFTGVEHVLLRDAIGPILAKLELDVHAHATIESASALDGFCATKRKHLELEERIKQTVATHGEAVVQYMILLPKTRRRLLMAAALFSIMLLIGSGAFMGLSFIGTGMSFWPSYPAEQYPDNPVPPVIVPIPYDPWTFSESYYFMLSTALVIGYGSMAPPTTPARAFLIFYATVAIAVSGNFLLATRDFLVLRAKRHAASSVLLLRARKRRNQQQGSSSNSIARSDIDVPVMDDEQVQRMADDPRDKHTAQVFLIFRICMICLIYWLVGAWLFTLVQPGWSYFDSLYFLYVSAATIGFGDYVPSTPASWELLGLFVLLMLPLFALVLSGMQEVFDMMSRHRNQKLDDDAKKRAQIAKQLQKWSAT